MNGSRLLRNGKTFGSSFSVRVRSVGLGAHLVRASDDFLIDANSPSKVLHASWPGTAADFNSLSPAARLVSLILESISIPHHSRSRFSSTLATKRSLMTFPRADFENKKRAEPVDVLEVSVWLSVRHIKRDFLPFRFLF
jgi:hypothetical protein